jgi:hypothetical protein
MKMGNPVSSLLGPAKAWAKTYHSKYAQGRAKPTSISTGSGTPAVEYPPNVLPPPNATVAVAQQLATSQQLEENTFTTAGTGAGRESHPVTYTKNSPSVYWVLVILGGLLVVTFAWDRGKL